jgi:rhamnose utilization protein RhaD (predicted bifunctional aldolase and dehydrogenase)
MKTKLKNLAEISAEIGGFPDYVQGGGGNTSAKLDDSIMAIKASGYMLKDVTETDGFALVNYKNIREFINRKQNLKLSLTEYIKDQIVVLAGYQNLRPSIETGFHSLLSDYVIHTHSVYSNILCCTEEGEKIAKKLFNDSIYVNYVNPGQDLTLEVKKGLNNNIKQIIFLKNHGLIVSASSSEETLNLHRDINQKIKDYFNIKDSFEVTEITNLDSIKKDVLFPDQVVYVLSEEMLSSVAGKETIAAYYYILNQIKKNKLTPSFISKKNVEIITNMESEKYRKKIAKGKK